MLTISLAEMAAHHLDDGGRRIAVGKLAAPWPQGTLPPAPDFYQQIARDSNQYGILDLPMSTDNNSPDYASTYQMYQLISHKPIAWGYLSHPYSENPVPAINRLLGKDEAPDLLLNGKPANPNANAQAHLYQAGYRYVVWHKVVPNVNPSQTKSATAHTVIEDIFGASAVPTLEDGSIEVYEITSTGVDSLTTAIKLGSNWHSFVSDGRWATSPATLEVNPRAPKMRCFKLLRPIHSTPRRRTESATKVSSSCRSVMPSRRPSQSMPTRSRPCRSGWRPGNKPSRFRFRLGIFNLPSMAGLIKAL